MDDVEAKNLFARTGITLGETLDGRYQVVEILGRGGMGTVFRAINLSLNKPVAVKALHMSLDQFAEMRFKQEIKAMSMLSHPHLISVLDAGTTPGGTPYFVMEFLDGPALGDLLKTQGVLPDVRAIRMFIQMADALAYAHEQGIIHRDLKPNNVVVLSNRGKDFIKLVDLGIAKLLTPGDQQGLTVTGEIFGSPIYMSPEQCSAKDVDARSDIYSLGCLMFETICGEPPIKGGSALETFNLHMTSEAPLLSAVPGMHMTPALKALEPVIARCVRIRPEERIQTMAELSEALERIDRSSAGGQPSAASSGVKPAQSVGVNPRASLSPDAQNEIGSTVITGANKASSDNISRPARVQQAPPHRESKPESPLANKNLLVGVGVFAVVLIIGLGSLALRRNPPAPAVAPDPVTMPTFAPPSQFNQSPVDYEKLAKEMASKQMARRSTVSYPESSSKSKVEVVAVYMGKNQEGGNPQLPGDVQVDVKYSDKPVSLVLVSYMPVNWKIMRDGPAVKISRIMVSSYMTPTTVTGVPAGVQVEKSWFPFLSEDGRKLDHPRSDNPFEVFSMGTSLNPGSESVEGSSDFQNMKKIVETHLGEPLKSFQGAYSDDHFTVQ
ncbi:MAG: serine/threonine protein kinase [Cyanobacteria bacterium SZAS-4]|nr:serine/threonine protein kinase [Cyanobacteria bacterium SZAS-4]